MSASELLEDHLVHLAENGFVLIDGFLDSGKCQLFEASLQEMIDKDSANIARDKRDEFMVHNPMFRDRSFYELLRASLMTEIVDNVLSDTSILYALTTSTMPPHGTNWSRRIHVDCPRLIPNYVTNLNAFIPLCDSSEENGGIELLPKSHWRAAKPSSSEFDSARIVPSMTAGTLLIFYSRLWHSGGQNNSENARHAITFNFCRSYMRQRFDYPRMISETDLASLDSTQRRLLGFNVRVPSSLDEYYLPESDRLYRADQG